MPPIILDNFRRNGGFIETLVEAFVAHNPSLQCITNYVDGRSGGHNPRLAHHINFGATQFFYERVELDEAVKSLEEGKRRLNSRRD